MLRGIQTMIGGMLFTVDYIVLRPEVMLGFRVFLGRPWMYAADVIENRRKKTLSFRSKEGKDRSRVTISWDTSEYQG